VRIAGTHWIGAGLDVVAKRKKSHYCPYRDLNPDHAARNLVTIPTELPRLRS
jgi:hypothetical protein